MKLNGFVVSGATVLLVAAAVVPGNAQAVASSRSFYTNAVGVCQASAPQYDEQIRKRPQAIQNEGTAGAWVNCAFISQGFTITSVNVYARNTKGFDQAITCTGVTGYVTGTTENVVKSIVLPAGGAQNHMLWVGADFSGGASTFPAGLFGISCYLPPGVGLNDAYVNFSEDVGT